MFSIASTSTISTTAFAVPDPISVNRNTTPQIPSQNRASGLLQQRNLYKGFRHRQRHSGINSSSIDTNSNVKSVKPAGVTSAYYLLLSRKSLLRIVGSTALLLLLHFISPSPIQKNLIQINYLMHPTIQHHCHSSTVSSLTPKITQLSLPLLSSACCLVQLVLNIFSIGCAGLNTFLGPLRPYFMGLLTYFTMTPFLGPKLLSPKWFSLGLSWGLAWLPELLHTFNNFRNGSNALDSSTRSTTFQKKVTVQIHVPTMGCVACVNKIQNSLNACLSEKLPADSSYKVDSWLVDKDAKIPTEFEGVRLEKGGIAQIVLETPDEDHQGNIQFSALINELSLAKTIEEAGFKGSQVLFISDK